MPLEQVEIPIPPQPPELTKFKRQQQCWLKKHPTKAIFIPAKVIEHYSWKDAYRIVTGTGEMTVSVAELYTDEEKDEWFYEIERKKCEVVINLFAQGHRTAAQMMAVAGGPLVKWHNMIKAAQRRGFIA